MLFITAALLLFWLHPHVDFSPRLCRLRFSWLRFRSRLLPVSPSVAHSPPSTLHPPSTYAEGGLFHWHQWHTLLVWRPRRFPQRQVYSQPQLVHCIPFKDTHARSALHSHNVSRCISFLCEVRWLQRRRFEPQLPGLLERLHGKVLAVVCLRISDFLFPGGQDQLWLGVLETNCCPQRSPSTKWWRRDSKRHWERRIARGCPRWWFVCIWASWAYEIGLSRPRLSDPTPKPCPCEESR